MREYNAESPTLHPYWFSLIVCIVKLINNWLELQKLSLFRKQIRSQVFKGEKSLVFFFTFPVFKDKTLANYTVVNIIHKSTVKLCLVWCNSIFNFLVNDLFTDEVSRFVAVPVVPVEVPAILSNKKFNFIQQIVLWLNFIS